MKINKGIFIAATALSSTTIASADSNKAIASNTERKTTVSDEKALQDLIKKSEGKTRPKGSGHWTKL